jgi:hypothetical protein
MPSSDLEEWNRHWRLHADRVICRTCQAYQFAVARKQPFAHSPNCPYRTYHHAPWDKLDSALQAINASW